MEAIVWTSMVSIREDFSTEGFRDGGVMRVVQG